MSIHKMRHAFATDLVKKGVNIRVVQEILGHSNIQTTQIYTHVTRDDVKEALGKALGSEEGMI